MLRNIYSLFFVIEKLNSNKRGSFDVESIDKINDYIEFLKYRINNWQTNKFENDHPYNLIDDKILQLAKEVLKLYD